MSNPRIRSRNTPDGEFNPTSRIVTPRRSLSIENFDSPDHANHAEETDRSPTLSRSPPAIHPSILSSPIVPTYDSPPRHQADARQWDWMPDTLQTWREEERIPILPNAPGSQAPTHPLTLEPAHHTVPILITRLVTHEHRLDQLDQTMHDRADSPTSEIALLQHHVSELEDELTELRGSIVETHNEGVEEVARLRQRVVDLEEEVAQMRASMGQVSRLAEAVIGMTTAVMQLNQNRG